MNFELIEQVIKIAKQHDLLKISVECDEIKINIEMNKQNQNDKCINNAYKNSVESMDSLNELTVNDGDYMINAPLLGTVVILINNNTGEKYKVGDLITKGQAFCTIEAMKMINEITSDKEGIITQMLVTSNQFVEYDQPLIKIKENGGNNV
ncbi:acetyl-CoA carboxylase biotin carboxyl carrier protein [Clostridium fungisolvens]|uniref:Lipoyl-binding domain-containing protein n=1 Tax=Clostridium fungisolvens TaxID=1604897 RepID=A0A6V8SMH0_9CLOT|nr:biotin/lipoyl-containing protein [Clostridium fungisolvens]GFP77752.1 hypothetical protein bsdtw1_03923 [Clostridium fungisolvens]